MTINYPPVYIGGSYILMMAAIAETGTSENIIKIHNYTLPVVYRDWRQLWQRKQH